MLDALQQRFSEFDHRQLPRLAMLGIGAVLVLALLWPVGALYSAAQFTPVSQQPATPAPADQQRDYRIADVTRQNLFGSAAGGDSLDQANLPSTHLQLVLRGVFTSTNPRQASAIIEQPNGDTRSFRVRDRVFGEARLHAVFKDRVVLSRNGELETLRFPLPGSEPGIAAATTAGATAESLPPAAKRALATMSAEDIQQARRRLTEPGLTEQERKQLIRQRLMELRNRARDNQP